MATISKTWRTEATPMNAVTLADTTESFSSDINLETDGYEASHVTIDVTFGTTPEYNAIASVYGSLDGSNYDDVAIFSQEITLLQLQSYVVFPNVQAELWREKAVDIHSTLIQ